MATPAPAVTSSGETGELDPATNARTWLLESFHGAVGTLSVDPESAGYPFLSVAPYALDERGRPLFQMADIAMHTRNILADPRASLMVQEAVAVGGDPQSAWRITLLGKIERADDNEQEEAFARFEERVRAAREYQGTHGFSLYRLEIERVRFIGGFGKICWLPGASVMRDPLGAGLDVAAPPAIAHMNVDHKSSMVEMCEGLYGFKPERAEMLKLDRTGFLVRSFAPDRLCHFSFGREIDADTLRPAVISVLKRARTQGQLSPGAPT